MPKKQKVDKLAEIRALESFVAGIPLQIENLRRTLGEDDLKKLESEAQQLQKKEVDILSFLNLVKTETDTREQYSSKSTLSDFTLKLYEQNIEKIFSVYRQELGELESRISVSPIQKQIYNKQISREDEPEIEDFFDYEFRDEKPDIKLGSEKPDIKPQDKYIANALSTFNAALKYEEKRKASKKKFKSIGRNKLAKRLQQSIDEFVQNPTPENLGEIHNMIYKMQDAIKSKTSSLLEVTKDLEKLIQQSHSSFKEFGSGLPPPPSYEDEDEDDDDELSPSRPQ